MILHSRLPKGWTPRTPKRLTHAEFPGTAVYWDDEYYEVLAADPLPSGGVRYVLDKWRDDHTIRVFDAYSDESEARLLADHQNAMRQQRRSVLARLSGVVLGHLPAAVQERLGNELGVFPARMTLLSTIPFVVLFGVCVWFYAGSRMSVAPSPVPGWLWLVAIVMLADSGVRFFIAMSQNRGAGSFAGTLLYGVYRLIAGKRNPPPRLTLEAPEDVVRRDAVEMRSWMFTLLPASEQRALAQRYEYDYRKDAYTIAGAILAGGAIGILSSLHKPVPLAVAALIVVEQIVRMIAFSKGPMGSVFGFVVRPLVRDFTRRQP